MAEHPSDNVAKNLDLLFVSPTVGDANMQASIDAVVSAGREFADKLLMEVTTESADRQQALAYCRMAFERAVIAIMTMPPPGEPDVPEVP